MNRMMGGVGMNAAQLHDNPMSTKRIPSDRALRELVSPVKPASWEPERGEVPVPWVWIRSKALEDTILLVLDVKQVREAEEKHPEACIYVVAEIEILGQFTEDKDSMRALHRIKKDMRGWLVDPRKQGR